MEQLYRSDQNETPIDFKEYLILFWSWAWLIILSGIITGAAAYYVSSRQIPLYQTSTRLLVSNPPSLSGVEGYNSMINSYTMPNTYAEMVVVAPVLQGVIDKLQLNMTVEDLKGNVSVELVADTQILVVSVVDTNPVRATDIANSISEVYGEYVRKLYSQRYASSLEGVAKQVQDMSDKIDATNLELDRTISENDKQQLQARLTEYTSLYADLLMTYEQVRLAEAQTSANVVVTEPAFPNYVPISPRTTRNTALAFAIGMLIAAGSIFLVDLLDDTIKNPEEIRKVSKLPILGVIARHSITEGKPVVIAHPRSPTAEAFRSLRTNIQYASVGKQLHLIIVTSPTPRDGKTTVSSNLAAVMSQGEKQVVLIDADMRRPQLHQRFGLLNRFGLSDLFVQPLEKVPEAEQTTESERLTVITSGSIPPNPAELLTSERMDHILEMLMINHDVVIVDTPPVLSVTDAAALARSVDGVVLVARPGATKMRAFKQSVDELRGVNANILGVVLNDVAPASRRYGYYYSHYYSNNRGYYDMENKKGKK